MNKDLFSFGIIAYNNYEFIKEAVDSVLVQDYPNIELIISNDGSDDFKSDELDEYINLNKSENIKKVFINSNETNIGTVRNINYICNNSTGKYIMFMAADDALNDSRVLSRFVEEFEKHDSNTVAMCGSIAFCGERLDDIHNYVPTKEQIDLLKEGDNKKIFSYLTFESFIPTTSTCLRKDILEKTGYFDESYFIIEDASKYIKLIREGYKFGWIDDFVGARHRGGGISHGNSRNTSESYRRYRFDEILLYTKEILPYLDDILPKDLKKMKKKWNFIESSYYKNFLLNEEGAIEYRYYDKTVCMPLVKEFEKRLKEERIKERIKNSFLNISLKKVFRDITLILISLLGIGLIEKIVSDYQISILGSSLVSEICIIAAYILLFVLLIERIFTVFGRVAGDFYKLIRR